jgi:hypothetical protein
MKLSNNQSSKVFVAILAVLSLALILGQVGEAQAGNFNNKSLKGEFSFTSKGEGGAVITISAGIIEFDGEGNATGSGFLNAPNDSPPPERQIIEVEITGTYTVNEDGTGTGSATFTVGELPIGTFDYHFVITDAKKNKALEFFGIEDQPDELTGTLSILTGKKL